MVLGMAALGMSCSVCAGGSVTYGDTSIVPMTEEEKEQKSNEMRQWMEEKWSEYEAWNALSYYEQYGVEFEENGKLILPEGIEKIWKGAFQYLSDVAEIVTVDSDKKLVSGLLLPPDLSIIGADGSAVRIFDLQGKVSDARV